MSQAPVAQAPSKVDVENVQGDVILGCPKKKQDFIFFLIKKPADFKAALPRLKISTTGDVQRAQKKIAEARQQNPGKIIPLPFLNMAFSQQGLNALGIKDNIGDQAFSKGQLADAQTLGDSGMTNDKGGFDPAWERAFTGPMDGMLLAMGDSRATVNDVTKTAMDTLGPCIQVVYTLKCGVRPDPEKGHEHFGWNDGLSNPAVQGVVTPAPGQRVIPPGVLLLGASKDPVPNRPSWAKDGSFLVFRQLNQLVPEFHDFLAQNPIVLPGLDRKQGSELMGARLLGRWKSGAPLALTPTKDDPVLAKDDQRNNKFVYSQARGEEGQTACPYAAHIRKTNPRNDLDPTDKDNTKLDNPVTQFTINRAGITYGPEVTPSEQSEKLTEHERGLAFVSYQSALLVGSDDNPFNSRGFRFMQRSWCNDVTFPPGKAKSGAGSLSPGFDPIVGQDSGKPRETLGGEGKPKLKLPQDFVISRGGEYFFSPSIKALKTTFAGVSK